MRWAHFSAQESNIVLSGQMWRPSGHWPLAFELWLGSAAVVCIKSTDEQWFLTQYSSRRPQLSASLVLFVNDGRWKQGHRLILLESVTEFNHSLSCGQFSYFWSFHYLSAAWPLKLHSPAFCSRVPGGPRSPGLLSSACLLTEMSDSCLEFQCLFITYRTIIWGNFEFILIWVLRKRIDYSSSPIKYVPSWLFME